MEAASDTGLDLVARVAARLVGPPGPDVFDAVASDLLALGDWCVLDLGEDGRRTLKLLSIAHRDPAQAARGRAARLEHPLDSATAGDADPVAGPLRWTSWVTEPLAAHGQVVGALTIASSDPARPLGDAERRVVRTIAALVGLSAAAQRVARDRDELLGVVSHDLRNPLGVILLVVDLLRQSAQPVVAGQMGRLERAAQTMGRILTDLVDAGRVGAHAVPLETEMVPASRIVADACQAVQAAADQKGVTVDRSIAPVDLRADRVRVTRVVEQLVQAAVGRTPSGKSVTVEVASSGEGGTVWTVTDAAPKTPAALEDSPARRAGALGWLVARGVVQAHGGSLWLERGGADGACTVVRFALPAAPPAR